MPESIYSKFMRDPLLLFMLCGSFIFASYAVFKPPVTNRIELSTELRTQLREEFEFIRATAATPGDIEAIERQYISDELLFREALKAGVHLADPTTRNSLIDIMRYRITALIPAPSESELVNYYAQHMQNYYTPNRVSFEHVFFRTVPANSDALLIALAKGDAVSGDSFSNSLRFTHITDGIVSASFGHQFLASLQASAIGQWHGPVESNYGAHFVKLNERQLAEPLAFIDIKERIENDFLKQQTQQAIAQKLDALKLEYEIHIEP